MRLRATNANGIIRGYGLQSTDYGLRIELSPMIKFDLGSHARDRKKIQDRTGCVIIMEI